MKRQFFGLSFLLFFFRLQIYEAMAAIFWQSASYASEFDFYLLEEIMSIVCVTLIKGYLRAATRSNKELYRFLIKI